MDPDDQIRSMIDDLLFDESDEQMAKMIFQQWQQATESEASNSGKRKRRYVHRDREAGHQRLFNDYFADNPVYPEHIFR